mmetsp:Transcript_1188/g.2256  ORF Transcript_1188/g.2256 Transcript_1188/m.2256 type:complete len:553 (+) Transcript_1188:59-1717(+)
MITASVIRLSSLSVTAAAAFAAVPLQRKSEEIPRSEKGFLGKCRHLFGAQDPYNGQLMTEKEKVKMSAIINELVDLSDDISEDEEQVIFEFAVDKIVSVMSADLTPVHHAMAKGHHRPLPASMVEMMSTRLYGHVDSSVSLPFLDRVDEARLKRSVIALVMHAMASDSTLQEVVELKNAKPIIVEVLTKGIANVFFDPEERANLVEALSINIKNVPFMPIGVLQMTLDYYIRYVGDHILEALTLTTDECLNGKRGDLGATYSEHHKQGAYAAVCLVELRDTEEIRRKEEEEEEEEDKAGLLLGSAAVAVGSAVVEKGSSSISISTACAEAGSKVPRKGTAPEAGSTERSLLSNALFDASGLVLFAEIEACADDGGAGGMDAAEAREEAAAALEEVEDAGAVAAVASLKAATATATVHNHSLFHAVIHHSDRSHHSFEILLRRNLASLLLLEFSPLLHRLLPFGVPLEKRAEICFKVAASLLSTCDFSKLEAFMKGSQQTPDDFQLASASSASASSSSTSAVGASNETQQKSDRRSSFASASSQFRATHARHK